MREAGDLGLAAERLLAVGAAGRPASLQVTTVVGTLHQIAEAEGPGSQGRKLDLLGGLLAQATPLEARYLLRQVTGELRLGIGTPTILDALAQVHAGGRAARPVLERAYNICCDLGEVAAALAGGGVAAVERSRSARGTRCGRCSPSGCPTPRRSWPSWAGSAQPSTNTTAFASRLTAPPMARLSCSPGGWSVSRPEFPDVVELLAAGLGPAEAIVEGEVVAFDPSAGELRPFGEVMTRRRKHGIADAVREVPVGLFCFELLYADGEDLTTVPYPQRRARLAEAITVSSQLRLTTATQVADPAALEAAFEQAITDGCEGLMCKSLSPDAGYQAGARGWLWIKLKRDYRTELSDTVNLAIVGAFAGRGHRAGVYGALLLAAYDPGADLFRAVTKCGTGFSDADLAALPGRLAPLARADKPARVNARQQPDVWFEPGLVLEILSAELTLSPTYTAAWGQIKENTGLAMRFPRFTGRWRDDKGPEDATTTDELVELYRTAQRAPASSRALAPACPPPAVANPPAGSRLTSRGLPSLGPLAAVALAADTPDRANSPCFVPAVNVNRRSPELAARHRLIRVDGQHGEHRTQRRAAKLVLAAPCAHRAEQLDPDRPAVLAMFLVTAHVKSHRPVSIVLGAFSSMEDTSGLRKWFRTSPAPGPVRGQGASGRI